jgi:RNase adapter protein RapZ
VLDIRAGDPAPAIERAGETLAADGSGIELIFLEASDASLISRFSETRHRHPLEEVEQPPGEHRRRAPPAERTRQLADHVIDTTGLSIGQLKDRLLSIAPASRPTVRTFRSTSSPSASSTASRSRQTSSSTCGFLTNPYWEPELKPLSGLEEPVRDFVLRQPAAARFLELVSELIELTAPAYRAEGKEHLRVALGCTGGYHRSIALAEELAQRLGDLPGATSRVFHRELER